MRACACVRACVHACVCACVRACMHVCAFVRVCRAGTYARIYALRAHTRMCVPVLLPIYQLYLCVHGRRTANVHVLGTCTAQRPTAEAVCGCPCSAVHLRHCSQSVHVYKDVHVHVRNRCIYVCACVYMCALSTACYRLIGYLLCLCVCVCVCVCVYVCVCVCVCVRQRPSQSPNAAFSALFSGAGNAG